ncbi:hypothetical protein, partial [Actinoplanes siamensis]
AVAGALVAAGDRDGGHGLAEQAEAMVRSVTTPSGRESTLVAVAGALAAAGDHDRAGQLLGGVLAAASWRIPLSVLADYWPQVVLRCVDKLSGNERSRHTEGT